MGVSPPTTRVADSCGTGGDASPAAGSTPRRDRDGDDKPADPDQPAPPVIELEDRSSGGLDLAYIEAALRAALAHLDRAVERVGVCILDEAAMARLHARHGGGAVATDVLTVPLGAPGAPIDADLAVCAAVAARCARPQPRGVEREILLYCVHGLLHCAGFDDHTPAGFRAMHAREDEILSAIGVGPVFADDDRPGGAGEPAP
jgi:probable rRNA maturation factor